ncbi:hypothetical protein WJX72_006091 [[Myrmecia] bisecta]|uniref:dAMP1 SANT/Myb-like domain-containing protein n=1 Tax=[Myrmecia] bisecta TaxID=41462 RepID=A0AAW1P4J2_9CHLO
MADVKDILGVSRTGSAADRPDVPKQKEKVQRPAGMSREAFALLDGAHPIVPSHLVGDLRKKSDLQGLKQKRKTSSKGTITYQMRPFTNPARADGLQLRHWVKCYKDAIGKISEADDGEYPFAKYNKKMTVFRYDDEEWENLIAKDPDWSREETDYLLDMCELLDLRFIPLADRYEFKGGRPRSLEDIKARYYSVARQLMIGREGSADTVAHQIMIKHPYNAEHEKQRKRAIELLLTRTPAQDAEDAAVLEEARAIEAVRRQEAAQRKQATPAALPTPDPFTPEAPVELMAPAEFPNMSGPGASSLFGADLQPVKPKTPSVVARGVHTREAAQQQLNRVTGGARAQKSVDTALTELGIPGPPTVPTRAVCGAWLALRAEVIAMQDLKRRLLNRQAAEGTLGGGGPEGRGKRAHKGKAPARYDEEGPKDKRPRTAKKYVDDD